MHASQFFFSSEKKQIGVDGGWKLEKCGVFEFGEILKAARFQRNPMKSCSFKVLPAFLGREPVLFSPSPKPFNFNILLAELVRLFIETEYNLGKAIQTSPFMGASCLYLQSSYTTSHKLNTKEVKSSRIIRKRWRLSGKRLVFVKTFQTHQITENCSQ